MDIQFRGISITVITPVPNLLVSDGVSTLDIYADIFETTSLTPISNETVQWTTTLGNIDTTTMTDVLGNTHTVLYSDVDLTGTALVRAHIGNMEIFSSATINLITLAVAGISVVPQFTSILADGLETDSLIVTAFDDLGGLVEDANIRFTTDAGLFSNDQQEIHLITNASGVAEAVLKSQPGMFDLPAHVIVSSFENPSVSELSNIMFRGITITVNSTEPAIIANEFSTTTITAQVKETSNGNPLVEKTVTWATNLGIIEPPSSITNSTGEAITTLHAQNNVGTATVQAIYGGGQIPLSGLITVELLPQPTPFAILLNSNYNGIIDNNSSLTISSTLTDVSSNPIINYDVSFSVTPPAIGSLSNSTQSTNQDGEANTQFIYPIQFSGTNVSFTVTAGPVQNSIQVTLP